MRAVARANTNIALVKYWGKRDAALNLPAVGIAVAHARRTVDAYDASRSTASSAADTLVLNGGEADARATGRVAKLLDLVRRAPASPSAPRSRAATTSRRRRAWRRRPRRSPRWRWRRRARPGCRSRIASCRSWPAAARARRRARSSAASSRCTAAAAPTAPTRSPSRSSRRLGRASGHRRHDRRGRRRRSRPTACDTRRKRRRTTMHG